jgi:hypothetical protein
MITLYSFVNYKKAFIWFLVYQIFVQFGIQLFSIGSLSLPLGLVTSAVFFLQFLLKKKYKDPRMKEFPFKVAFILLLLSRFITCFTAAGSFTEELNRAVTFSFQNIVNIYIAWYVFRSKKEFRYLFKIVTVVFFSACILGYYEYFAQYNPYTNYEKNFIGEGINYYSLESVRGFRITSVFEHPIGAGMNFGMYFVVALYLLINEGKSVPIRRLTLVTAFLCLPLVLLTKQRSAMIFTLIISIILLNFRKKRFYGILILILIGLFTLSPMLSNYTQYLTSIFDQNAQSQISGSSLTMRMMQLDACLQLLKTSPLFGIGEKYSNYISNIYTSNALMLESVWLDQMVKHGLLGICSYLVLAYDYIIKIPKKYNFGKLIMLSIGFWATYTITTIPSFRMYLLYVFIFYLINRSELLNTSGERKI